MTGSAEHPSADKRFERGGEEFSRVLAFSDGMFAIAMTLLVIGIEVPDLADADSVADLADALGDSSDSITSFVISFAVIGRYWLAHHNLFSLLGAFDRGLIGLNLVYLGLIAFLPFPTALFGQLLRQPARVRRLRRRDGLVSGFEVVLLRHAHRNGLFRREMPPPVYAWARNGSLMPVVVFAASIPLALRSAATSRSHPGC